VIAFSTGNHGRAVAHVCRELGIRAVICLSERVPAFRVQAMENLGAEVVRYGQSQDQAYQETLRIQADQGLTMVAPFDDPEIVAGQGTIGLELLEDLPGLGSVVVPVSGGGLMGGIALALKSAGAGITTVGVSMEVAPAMYRSLEAGRPVEIPEKDSLADALLGGIGLDNRFTFPLVRDLVDEMVLVSEEEIAQGMVFCLERLGLVAEGSGAVGVAALVSGRLKIEKGPAVLVLSGGNVDLAWLIKEAARSRAGAD
jgi:threonine dehydratase